MIRMPSSENVNQARKLLCYCLFIPLPAKYVLPYVIKSRLNDLNYIVITPRRRKKRQIWQVTIHGFSKEYKLTVDASDVGVGIQDFSSKEEMICIYNEYEKKEKTNMAGDNTILLEQI